MQSKTKWYEVAIPILVVIGLILLAGWGIRSCCRSEDEDQRQWVINAQSNTVYSLQHPVIVGTNELGEVVKQYTVEFPRYATIYEVGKTKTEVTHYSKGRTETKVSVEQQ